MLLLRECLPRKSHKRVDTPHRQPFSMHKVHEMRGNLPARCNENNTLDKKRAEMKYSLNLSVELVLDC